MNSADVFHNLQELETQRTVLRKIRIEDEQDIFEYCSDAEISKYTTWNSHQTIGETRAYMGMILELYKQQEVSPWGIQDKSSNKLIGTCNFVSWNTKHSRAEIAYALSRQYWGQGYMTEVVRKIIEFGFQRMRLMRIEARCFKDNIGSARVMEKTGMKLEGILRKQMYVKERYEDLLMYSIIRDDFEN